MPAIAGMAPAAARCYSLTITSKPNTVGAWGKRQTATRCPPSLLAFWRPVTRRYSACASPALQGTGVAHIESKGGRTGTSAPSPCLGILLQVWHTVQAVRPPYVEGGLRERVGGGVCAVRLHCRPPAHGRHRSHPYCAAEGLHTSGGTVSTLPASSSKRLSTSSRHRRWRRPCETTMSRHGPLRPCFGIWWANMFGRLSLGLVATNPRCSEKMQVQASGTPTMWNYVVAFTRPFGPSLRLGRRRPWECCPGNLPWPIWVHVGYADLIADPLKFHIRCLVLVRFAAWPP